MKNDLLMYDDPTGHFFNVAAAGALIGATAGYTGNTTKQYISTGKVNQRQAVISGVVNAIGGRNNKSTNNLKIHVVGGGSKPSVKTSLASSTSKVFSGEKKSVGPSSPGKGTGQAFNQANRDSGIPTSATSTKQGQVTGYKNSANDRRVYEYNVNGQKK
jgi:hypothetical protein